MKSNIKVTTQYDHTATDELITCVDLTISSWVHYSADYCESSMQPQIDENNLEQPL